ncbi:MAG TPA: winged helix DNA-binding domain-containing protein [Gaiellaceae bacterium]
MAERVLGARDLNRALLARQLLLERAKTPIPKALERIGGIQAQYAPSMYVGLWSRLEGFERGQLTRALERRSVVQGTIMRATIHLVSKADYWPFTVGIRDARTAWWERVHRNADPKTMKAAARKLRRFLADGPRRRKDVEDHLGRELALGVGVYVDIVRVPPSGTWEQRRADLYALAEDWVGPERFEPDEGLELLVRRYLAGFGPAHKTDVADFAGVPIGKIAGALERIELRRFRDEGGKELLDLPRAPLPDPDTPAPPRFLPVWDATLLVHARRTQILPEEHRARVFNVKTPHSVNTFLLDGQVAGTWRHEKDRIKVELFGRVPRGVKKELDEEAERLAAFHA